MSTRADGTRFAPSHLSRLMRAAGVGPRGRHNFLALETASKKVTRESGGRGLSRMTWSRLEKPIPLGEPSHRWAKDDLKVAADTLRYLGEDITFEEIDRAYLADCGHGQVISGDDVDEVLAVFKALSLDDQLRLYQEVSLYLEPDGPADQSRASTPPWTQREG